MSQVECPYCGHENDIDHCDGHGTEEGVTYEQECSGCEKIFAMTACISIDLESHEAPCMNGSEHKFKPTATIPKWYTRMRCEWCDQERKMTPEEKVTHEIPENPYVEDNQSE